jgi:hypothetical protein
MLHYQRSLLYCFSALSELSPEELGGLEGALKKIGKRAAALVEQGAGETKTVPSNGTLWLSCPGNADAAKRSPVKPPD